MSQPRPLSERSLTQLERGLHAAGFAVLRPLEYTLNAAGFAVTRPLDVKHDDGRAVVLIAASRLPRNECPIAVARVLTAQQSYVEFISYAYMSADGAIVIETTNASFNRREDLTPTVTKAIERLRDKHAKQMRAAFKTARLASRVHFVGGISTPLRCTSTYYLSASFDGGMAGHVRCDRHFGHDDDHRGVYRKGDGPGLFGDGRGLVWVNNGLRWIWPPAKPAKKRAVSAVR